jgi:hypothetical protein
LRHELSPEEEAQIKAGWPPELTPDIASELKLNSLLRQMPDAPVSSNFTARVMAAVMAVPAPRSSAWQRFFGGRWLPRPAWALLLLLGLLVVMQQVKRHNQSQTAHEMAKMSQAATAVSWEVLRDFDAIKRFSRPAVPVDEVLFAALN